MSAWMDDSIHVKVEVVKIVVRFTTSVLRGYNGWILLGQPSEEGWDSHYKE